MTDSTISIEMVKMYNRNIYKYYLVPIVYADLSIFFYYFIILFMWDFENCWMYVSGIFNLLLGIIIGYH